MQGERSIANSDPATAHREVRNCARFVVAAHGHATRDEPAWVSLWNLDALIVVPLMFIVLSFNAPWSWMALLVVLSLAVIFVYYYFLADRMWPARGGGRIDGAIVPSGSIRATCYGEPAELRRVASAAVTFGAPRVFACLRVSLVVRQTAYFFLIGFVYFVASLPGVGKLTALAVMLGVMVVASLITMFGRDYYRVVPGRLDVVRALRLSSRVRLEKSIDLRERYVICRFDRRELLIQGSADVQEEGAVDDRGLDTYRIALDMVDRPHTFAKRVIQAACYEGPEPPALPEGELVG